MPDEQGQPTEEEIHAAQAAMEEQMRNIKVEEVVLQTTATLVNLGARKLGLGREPGQAAGEEVDVTEAKAAIDAARALAPLCPAEQVEPIKQALSQLQMAYVQAAGPAAEGAPAQDAPAAASEPDSDAAGEDQAERDRARSKIWTPPGS